MQLKNCSCQYQLLCNLSKIKFVKKLKNKRFYIDWFSKIALKNIQNKLNFADQETCWELQEIKLERGDLTRKKGFLDKVWERMKLKRRV